MKESLGFYLYSITKFGPPLWVCPDNFMEFLLTLMHEGPSFKLEALQL